MIFKRNTNLIECLKDYTINNPDRLKEIEITFLLVLLANKIQQREENKGQQGLYEIFEREVLGIRRGIVRNFLQDLKSNDPEALEEDYSIVDDFFDYYQLGKTESGTRAVFKYVINYFPKEKYRKVLCVGDGKRCHLSRLLAEKGYLVIGIDPNALTVLENCFDKTNGGRLNIFAKEYKGQTSLNYWADIIVGARVPMIADYIINSSKDCVFTGLPNSKNCPIVVQGTSVEDEKDFYNALNRVPNLDIITEYDNLIYVRGGRQRNRNRTNKSTHQEEQVLG